MMVESVECTTLEIDWIDQLRSPALLWLVIAGILLSAFGTLGAVHIEQLRCPKNRE